MEKYYITEVDRLENSIYCYHDLMGELLIPPHVHVKGQLIYTEGGTVHIRTTLNTYYLPARHCMWIPSGVKHSIHTNSEKTIMRNLYFPPEEGEDEFYTKEGIYPVGDLLYQLINFSQRWTADLPEKDPLYITALSIKRMLPFLCKEKLPLALPLPVSDRLKTITEFIADNIEEGILYSNVARQFGFTERTLHRLFKKELGLSFGQYQSILKMLKAIELLSENKLSINEIAAVSGYNSVSTFSNTFCKYMGIRPSEYLR